MNSTVNERIRRACGIEHEEATTAEKAPEEERRPRLECGSRAVYEDPGPFEDGARDMNDLLREAVWVERC